MTLKHKFSHKVLSILLCAALLMTYLPFQALTVSAASDPMVGVSKITDAPTVNDWEKLFLKDSTRNAGSVWTDKSVFGSPSEYFAATKDDETSNSDYYLEMQDQDNNFLVSLSAMASNKTVTGYSTAPTDTVLVLDLSSSMEGSNYNSIAPLARATNNAVKQLLSLNKNNRVAVVIYSGAEGQNSDDTLPTRVLMPLDRYTTTDAQGDFIEFRWIGGEEGIAVVSGVANSKKQTNFGLRNNQSRWSAGTFTQDGIYVGTQILLEADQYIEEGNVQAGRERVPIMVLMTDGEPSVFSTDYAGDYEAAAKTAGIDHLESFHKASTTATGTETQFMVQLSAAYAKYKIEQKYKEHDLLFYSLGLRGNDNFDETILDPANHNATDRYWSLYLNDNTYKNLYLKNERVDRTYQITTGAAIRQELKAAVTSTANENMRNNGLNKYRYYIDKYFEATNDTVLESAFQEIVDEIVLQSRYYPTKVEDGTDINYGGHLSMVDTLGKYMEVKDMKNIQIGNQPFYGRNAARELASMTSVNNSAGIAADLFESVKIRLGVDSDTALEVIKASQQSGKLYFNNNKDFNNAIYWYGNYSDAVAGAQYLAPWNGNGDDTAPANADCTIASYYFYGAGETNEGTTRVGDMRFIEVDVVTFLDGGESKVRIRVPASLIPLVTYEVQLDGETLSSSVEEFKVSDDTSPIRLIYEVGLKDDINSLNVGTIAADAYNSETDKYEFYSNKWDYSGGNINIGVTPPRTVANSYAYFEPSDENEYMYYQYDTTIFTKSGDEYTPYTGNASPSGSGFYGRRYYYTKPGAGSKTVPQFVYYEIDPLHLNEDDGLKRNADNTWFLPKGSHILPDSASQINYKAGSVSGGPTQTYKTSTTYFIEHKNEGGVQSYNMEVALGNNGKLSMEALQGIRLQKLVPQNSGIDAGESFEFTITPVSGSLTGSFKLYRVEGIDNDGTGGATAINPVTAVDGSIEVTLGANETIYIADLPAGEYTVTEKPSETYVVSAINGSATESNVANVTVSADKFATTSFTNIARGTGDLTISKDVKHPYGTDFSIPTDKLFNMTVTLSLDGVALANRKFTAGQTANSNITQVVTDNNGQFQINLSHSDQIEIFDLPAGTKATVVESAVDGFKPVYWENSVKDTENNGKGEVVVEQDGVAYVLVVNEYQTPDSVKPNITVGGTKTLTTDTSFSGEFEFVLQSYNGSGDYSDDASWTTMSTEQVSFDITATTKKTFEFENAFSAVEYTETGVYIYRIIETKLPAIKGVVYDQNIHTFQVNVTDNDLDGKLEINSTTGVETKRDNVVTVTPSGGNWTVSADFSNEFINESTAQVVIDVQKHITNASKSHVGLVLDGFTFELWQKNGSSPLQTLKTNSVGAVEFVLNYVAADEGTHNYIVKEKLPTGYQEGKPWKYDLTEKEFKVVVSKDDENVISAVVTEVGASPANTDNYIETDFTNIYTPELAELELNVTKQFIGRNMSQGEFAFEITPYDANSPILDSNGNKIQANKLTAVNAAADDGEKAKVNFQKLYFNEIGKFFYDVKETTSDGNGIVTDKNVYSIVVNVSDVDGELKADCQVVNIQGEAIDFVNHYSADPVEHAISGTKVLTGRTLRDGEFTFKLTEAKDAQGTVETTALTYNADNDLTAGTTDKGTFTFPKITYDKAGEYYYVVTEEKGPAGNGVTYSEKKYVVTVKVIDNGLGSLKIDSVSHNQSQLLFENSYKADKTSVDIAGNKYLSGNRYIKADDFTFELYSTNSAYAYEGSEPIGVVKNAADGSFVFEDIEFTTADTYYFVVKEFIPAVGIKGVKYDTSRYNVSVTVKDIGSGELVAEAPVMSKVTEDGTQSAITIAFYNDYKGEDAVVSFGGEKNLKGRDLLEDEFTFLLDETDESFAKLEGSDTLVTKNKADGTFAFEDISFSEVGTYYYVISEDSTEKLEGVKYDTTKYYVTVNVTDDTDEGKLVAECIITTSPNSDQTEEVIVFNNEYIPNITDITVDVNVGKTVENIGSRSITAEGFEFCLKNSDTGKELFAKSNADGKAKFGLEFTKDDIGKTYNYTLTEVEGNKAFVKYSDVSYDIAVQITLDENNKLVATLSQDGEEVDTLNAEFVNVYNFVDTDEKSPVTGDTASNGILWMLVFFSGISLLGILVVNKKMLNK